MKVTVSDHCMGCCLCVQFCPAVFTLTEFGAAEIIWEIIPDRYWETVRHAADFCPTFAIEEMA